MKSKIPLGIFDFIWFHKKYSWNSLPRYAITTSWPENNVLTLSYPVPSASTVIYLLGYQQALQYPPHYHITYQVDGPIVQTDSPLRSPSYLL